MRVRLTPAEREARRRERSRHSFSDAAYAHYDPAKEGWGTPDSWEEIARKVFGLARLKTGPVNKWLAALYLDTMPASAAELKKAFRAAMFKNHPDYGGTNEAARETMEAYETLQRRFA